MRKVGMKRYAKALAAAVAAGAGALGTALADDTVTRAGLVLLLTASQDSSPSAGCCGLGECVIRHTMLDRVPPGTGFKHCSFWSERGQLLVTNRKLPAVAYIDDRGIRFESWDQALADLARLYLREGKG